MIDEKLTEYIESILLAREDDRFLDPESEMTSQRMLKGKNIVDMRTEKVTTGGNKESIMIDVITKNIGTGEHGGFRVSNAWHLNLMHSADLRKMLKFINKNCKKREKINEPERRRYIEDL